MWLGQAYFPELLGSATYPRRASTKFFVPYFPSVPFPVLNVIGLFRLHEDIPALRPLRAKESLG